jgi:hypothetical protein
VEVVVLGAEAGDVDDAEPSGDALGPGVAAGFGAGDDDVPGGYGADAAGEGVAGGWLVGAGQRAAPQTLVRLGVDKWCGVWFTIYMTNQCIDLNTAEGVADHIATLPTENLRGIAAREIFVGPVSNVLLVVAAELELIKRGVV